MQGKTQHIIRGSTNTCDSAFYTSDRLEETAAAAACAYQQLLQQQSRPDSNSSCIN